MAAGEACQLEVVDGDVVEVHGARTLDVDAELGVADIGEAVQLLCRRCDLRAEVDLADDVVPAVELVEGAGLEDADDVDGEARGAGNAARTNQRVVDEAQAAVGEEV